MEIITQEQEKKIGLPVSLLFWTSNGLEKEELCGSSKKENAT